MWFSASTKHFVGMNRFGKLEKIIDLGDRFILHHDYALDDDGNIVSLATDLTRSDHAVQDQAIKVNTSTGKVTKLVDFGEMFPDYKASTGHCGKRPTSWSLAAGPIQRLRADRARARCNSNSSCCSASCTASCLGVMASAGWARPPAMAARTVSLSRRFSL